MTGDCTPDSHNIPPSLHNGFSMPALSKCFDTLDDVPKKSRDVLVFYVMPDHSPSLMLCVNRKLHTTKQNWEVLVEKL